MIKTFIRNSYLITAVLFIAVAACSPDTHRQRDDTDISADSPGQAVEKDLPQIRARGRLIALTRFNANSYFLYRGQPMGYEFELLSRLAGHLGLELEIRVPKKWDDLIPMLYRGEGDIIAANMTVTLERARRMSFTDHHTTTRQVLVQRKPDNWRQLSQKALRRSLVRSQLDLIGKKVHVRKGSPYERRLQNLSQEIGGRIDIVAVSGDMETEQLIRQVAEGSIDYTVADENIARINKAYFPDIDITTPISFPQRIAWAVRPNAPALLAAVNTWIDTMKKAEKPDYYVIYNKYYKNNRFFNKRMQGEFYSLSTGKLSPFDNLIKKAAGRIGWDWKLLAALIYHESRFSPREKSWAGARGLMQVMPKTAAAFGIKDLFDPEKNLQAGTAQIAWLQDYWQDIPNRDERLKFVVASYNTGHGHVQDARRLAKKYGKNPDIWEDHTAEYLLKKALEKYYSDDVVEYGYCRGHEPVGYVANVLRTYRHYRRFFKDGS